MARKNHVYSQETPRSTGLSESRITASTTPSATPRTIDATVTRMVPFQKPSSTGLWFIACSTKGQLKASLLTSRLASIRARTAITAIATQRHGCRTGRASIRPGRSTASGGAAGAVVVTG